MSPELAAFLASWEFPPIIVLGILASALLYGYGWWRLARQGRGRQVMPAWCAWCYAAGLVLLALAFFSPVSTFSGLLFSMHMIQHLLLIFAAPLLLLGRPLLPMLWVLPSGLRREIGLLFTPGHPLHLPFRFLTHPIIAATLYMGNLLVWHVPVLYDAAQGRTLIHELEHVFYLGTSMLYWWLIVHPTGGRRRLSYGAGIFYLLPTFVESNVIGLVLTFANQPLYETYRLAPRLFGISTMFDQQFAGAIMWVVGGWPHLLAIFVLLYLYMKKEHAEKGSPPRDRVARLAGE